MYILKFLTFLFGKLPMVNFFKKLSYLSRKVSTFSHHLQMYYEWTFAPQPEWFDHYCDQYYQFNLTRNPLWVERGTFGLLAIKPDSSILELCCGDGFNTFHFYSIRAKNIISVDFDETAISHAKKYNNTNNIEYRVSDIRYEMPEGKYDNIVWDAAIEHFTEEEIAKLMFDIKSRLKENGVLTGYTIVENAEGTLSLSHHEREFKSKEDLKSFFEPHFKNVKVFETIYPSRHNLYFYASDSILPFDENWDSVTIKK
jgi:SAM-dependent methyltransferase